MMMRKIAVLFLVSLMAMSKALPLEAAIEKPNIVFLLVDDQRHDMLGCAGHPLVKTPTIDRLAERGTRFSNAFVTSPICAASRASIFTGLNERTHGFNFDKPPVPQRFAHQSYPMLLRQAGYRTGFFGKYGVAMDIDLQDMFDQCAIHYRPYLKKDGSHVDETITKEAIQFLETQTSEQPFCLSVSFNSVHAEDGNHVPGESGHFPVIEEMKGVYADVAPQPPRLCESYTALPDFLKTSLNRTRYFWRWDTPGKYIVNMQAYYGLISGMDRLVARILAALEARGLADNTIIIYAGDNGLFMGNRGLAGKWNHFAESLHVPLIVTDLREQAPVSNQVVSRLALNIDIPATILDYAGIDVPGHYQGQSLIPLTGGNVPGNWRTDFFCEHQRDHAEIPKWEGVRSQKYVYARYTGETPAYECFYDLATDPDELNNLAENPQYSQPLQQMRTRCDEYISTCTPTDSK
jgi:arylsulfatase A-like enzyme